MQMTYNAKYKLSRHACQCPSLPIVHWLVRPSSLAWLYQESKVSTHCKAWGLHSGYSLSPPAIGHCPSVLMANSLLITKLTQIFLQLITWFKHTKYFGLYSLLSPIYIYLGSAIYTNPGTMTTSLASGSFVRFFISILTFRATFFLAILFVNKQQCAM